MSCPFRQQRETHRSPRGAAARSRQGVVLLVVLTLLSLFVVICTTFILVASQYNRAAQSFAKEDIYRDPPQKLLDGAFYQIVRGTKDPQSVVRGHDLLGDMYGYFGFTGDVDDSSFDASTPEIHQVVVREDSMEWIYNDVSGVNLTSTPIDFWAGCVLTYVTGHLRGMSGRIVASRILLGPNRVVFTVRFDRDSTQHPTGEITSYTPDRGNRVVINGRAFTGAGFAYNPTVVDPTSPKLNRDALFPNWRGILLASTPNSFKSYIFGANSLGGAPISPIVNSGPNEDYDAPDFQNMALGAIVPNPSDPNSPFVIPSFHRPDLWAYHQAHTPVTDHRRAIMRPMRFPLDRTQPIDLGISTANNDFPVIPNLIRGPWDVDNNNDGIPDSIWVDVGFPINTDKSGRQYKPLAAYLCLDLDGRLNINYHGSQSHVNRAVVPQPADEPPIPAVLARGLLSNQPQVRMPRGSGWGPADINLTYLFLPPQIANPTDEQIVRAQGANAWLFYGPYNDVNANAQLIAGRYGYAVQALPFVPPQPGTQLIDPAVQFKFPGFPLNYFANDNTVDGSANLFGTPVDLRAQLGIGLDPRGAVATESKLPDPSVVLMANNPYELNANAPRGDFELTQQMPPAMHPKDQLFSAAELERILRSNDWDAPQLMSRLTRIFDGSRTFEADVNNDGTPDPIVVNYRFESPENRHAVTTESWDLPVPASSLRYIGLDASQFGKMQHHIVAALYDRLRDENQQSPLPPAAINDQIELMLGRDLRQGLKLNINGPFSPDIYDTGPNSRAFLARQLYVLMMLFKDPNALIDYDGNGIATPPETSYAIAQWAINAVDFRDRDSVMTPFEFDIYPFSNGGWNVDGIVGLGSPDDGQPHRGLVWGAERPELLISEAFAMHDRRTEDLDDPGNRTDDPIDPDEFFDQRLVPQGSLFVELYNPWAGNDDRKPPELYQATPLGPGVDLTRNPGGSPVWRLLVATTYDLGDITTNNGVTRSTVLDPDAPMWSAERLPSSRVERRVYFVPRNNLSGLLEGEPGVHAISLARAADLGVIDPVLPGRYVVIGPGREEYRVAGTASQTPQWHLPPGLTTIPQGYATPIGRRVSATDSNLQLDITRQIRLRPGLGVGVNQVFVLNNERPDVAPVPPATSITAGMANPDFPQPFYVNRKPATAVVIDGPPLSVSEPLGGYPATNSTSLGMGLGGEPAYEPPLPTPLDLGGAEEEDLNRTGTSEFPFRNVYLQRLADPTRVYDPVRNPYRTIDSIPVYLTAFNGLIQDPNAEPIPVQIQNEQFRTAQRGDSDALPGDAPNAVVDTRRRLWRSRGADPRISSYPLAFKETDVIGGSQVHNVPWRLEHSLGYLNWRYWPYLPAGTPLPDYYIGGPDTFLAAVDPPFAKEPFPWLKWNNRPYVNQYELLNVPATSSSRLLSSFTPRNLVANPYVPTISPDPSGETLPSFGHLRKFFTTSVAGNPAEHFYRLFEFVHVPSHFLGTETFTPTQNFKSFREPGRVNINTIYDPRVWNALRNGHPWPSFGEIVASRRGSAGADPAMFNATTSELVFDSSLFPTAFANPFRSPRRGDLVPLPSMVRPDVHTTLLRNSEPMQPPGLLGNVPLMTRFDPTAPEAPNKAHNNANRSSHFHYAGIQRTGNLVTTRSNVYAVWVTVGFFEVDGNGLLGQELGADTGEIERHRAFYILDRSIPVGYEPGENHNVDRAILLRRFIE